MKKTKVHGKLFQIEVLRNGGIQRNKFLSAQENRRDKR